MKKIICVVFLLSSFLSFSQDYYNDPSFLEIKESFINEDYSKLKKLVKKELDKPDQHSLIITIVEKIIADIDPEFENELTAKQKEIVNLSQEVTEYLDHNRLSELYTLYKGSSIIDELSVYQIGSLANNFDNISLVDVKDLIKRSLKTHGDHFRIAWVLENIEFSPFKFEFCAEILEDSYYDDYPAFRAYAKHLLEHNLSLGLSYWSNYSKLHGVKKYIETKPDDPIAIRRLANILKELGNYSEARELFLISYRLDPFYNDGLSLESAIVCAYYLDDYETAQKETRELVLRHFPIANQETKILELSAKLLYEFKDKMKARDTLSKILKIQPTNKNAITLLASIEMSDSRYDKALSLLKTLPKSELKKDLEYYNDYLYCLTKTESYDEFLEEWESFVENEEIGGIITYNRFFTYFFDAKEFEVAADFISIVIEHYPNSTWSLNNRSHANIELENYAEAEKDLRKVIALNPNNSWAVSKFKSVMKSLNKDVEQEIEKMYNNYPYSYLLMNEMKGFQDSDEQTEYLKSISDPSLRYTRDRNLYVNSSGYDLIAHLEKEFFKSKTTTDSLFYTNLIGEEYYHFGRKNSLSTDHLDKAMNYADLFDELGGSKRMVHLRKAYIYRSLENEEQARIEAQKSIEAAPLNQSFIRTSKIDFQNPTAITSLKKALDKNMYDYSNLERYIWINVMYPGSNINALWAYNKCTEIFPDKNCSSLSYKNALNKLGDPLGYMAHYKEKVTNLGNTDRYIRFYDSAREGSFNAAKQVLYDEEKNQVTTIDENGEVVIMKDDLMHGKPTLRQKGNVWITYDYNEKGNLTQIETSAKTKLNFHYNKDDKISRLESSERGNLDIEYNKDLQPKTMILNSKDSLYVYYNEQSKEIDSVTSNSGYSMSLQITQVFQDIMRLRSSYEIDDIGIENEEYTKIQEEYETVYYGLYEASDLTKEVIATYEKYVLYLKENLSGDADFSYQALDASSTMISYLESDVDLALKEQLLNFSVHFYDILKEIRRLGIANDYWDNWNYIMRVLESEKQKQTKLNNYRKKIESIQIKFKNEPLKLLASAEWLPKSDLNNNAYWTSTNLDEIYANYNSAHTEVNHIYKRYNGDILIAFNEGIAVKQYGFWKFLYYDTLNKKLLQDQNLINIKSKATFNYFIETMSEQLIVNTSSGTFILDDDYTTLQKIKIEDANYIGNKSCKMELIDDQILLYNPAGINIISTDEETFELAHYIEVPSNSLQRVEIYSDYMGTTSIYLQTDTGIEEIAVDMETSTYNKSKLIDFQGIKDFKVVNQEEGSYLYFINNNTLFIQGIAGSFYDSNPIENYQEILSNIVFNKEIFGLCEIPINEYENSLGVLTDMGVNIYKDNHFELFKIESKDGLDEFTKHYYNNYSSFGFISQQQFIEYSTEDFIYSEYQPKKIKTLRNKGITLILEGSDLYYSDNEYLYEDYITTDNYGTSITDFYVDKDESVYVSDYQTVYKLDFGNYAEEYEDGSFIEKGYTAEEIFSINPYYVEDFYKSNTSIQQIKVAKDGTIWVTTNLSVFRYNPTSSPQLKEFNYFKNEDEFPPKTLQIFNLIETYDGEIFVVTSSESWNNYKGTELDGGFVVYNKQLDKFEFIEEDLNKPNFPWFITSYSEISENEAILGTTSGFAYHSSGGIKRFNMTENQSYLDIQKNHKNLFLGTPGVEFGDFMLFGCAEGIVAYKDNQWFYPDRLNQLLPEFSRHGLWGGNKVNTLEVDHLNRLNIATDFGLLVINSNKIDPNDLMMMSRDTYDAIAYHDIDKLKKERETLVEALPSSSEVKKKVDEARELQDEIDDLEKMKLSYAGDFKLKDSNYKTISIDSVDTEINRITKKHSALLLTLKEKNPVIYQSLKVPPLGIAGIRNKLADDECIVQYIPLKERLIIQVVTKNKLILKEVVVSKEELFNLSLIASDLLSDRELGRGSVAEDISEDETVEVDLNEVLEQLYNHIISPVQADIMPYRNKIQIIAEGALNYVPFESLIFKDGKSRIHFAIENFNFTYLSSLYMLQLLHQFPEIKNGNSLLIGDPDNSLPHARKEVEDIASNYINNPVLLVSKQATVGKFKSESNKKEIIHLATHGFVDRNTIKDSWLMFSDSKLKLNEVYELNLDETNLLVLSACETGLGKDGLETTSLARAFANAGVQNIIASLWRVNDESTKILMTKFYDGINNGLTYMDALYQAKLHLIAYNGGEFENPKYWAPFLLFGKS